MKILERVQYVMKVVKEDYEAGGTLGSEIQRIGVAALLKGRTSPEWSEHMRIFADNKQQLARLTGKDDQAEQGYVKESTAYLIASSPCGGMTGTIFHYLMSPDIDLGLPVEPDGTIERPIPIPEPPAQESASQDTGRSYN
jgi:hypothetical protein